MTLSHASCPKRHIENPFVPTDNAKEAPYITGIHIFPVDNLGKLYFHLSQQSLISQQPCTPIDEINSAQHSDYDMKDIQGQEKAKRALEIAAAGIHNLLFKSHLAQGKHCACENCASIPPFPTFSEMLEITKVYSISSLLND